VARAVIAVDSWRRDPRAGGFALAIVAFGVFLLIALLAVLWPAFSWLDAKASALLWSVRPPSLSVVARWVTELGGAPAIVSAAVLLVLWMAVRRNWAAAVYVVMTVGVGWVLGNEVVKNIIRRDRPQGVNIAALPNDFSMPSGHSLAAFLFFATLCVIVMLNLPTDTHLKRWLVLVSSIAIIAVGFSRVYLGVHWFGDVLAAWLFGGAWWAFTTATYVGSVTEERRVALRSTVGSHPTSAE
jgi:undecaprenyl-diphosphatase